MITDLGSFSLGAAVPALPTATAAITASCDIAAPNVNAQLTALASFTPQVSLSIAAQIALVEATLASLQAALAAVPPIPTLDLSAQVALAAAAVVTLTAQLTTISAQVTIAANINALLAAAGVRVLVYSGQQDLFGSELDTELGGATTACNGLVLLTTSGATWTAMQGVFLTA